MISGNLHLSQNLVVDCPVLTGDAFHTIGTDAAGEQQLSIGLADYNLVVQNFNRSPATYAQGSFDYSGSVDLADYEAVLSNFNATLTAPPTTPGALDISNDGTNPQTTLDIDWSAPTPPAGLTIDHYELQCSTDGETFTTITQPGTTTPLDIPAGTTNYSDTALTAGNRYWYRVRAVYSDGTTSVYSAKQALNTILAPPTATVSADGTTISLVSENANQLNASTLTYTWTALPPSGTPMPTYSDNADATAESTTATVGAAGNYTFQATITAPGGVVVSVADVPVTVAQVATLNVSPSSATLAAGASQQFSVSGVDQFGNSVDTSAATWSVDSTDSGTIGSSGNYTAPSNNGGAFAVTASLDSASGSATAVVQPPAPTITEQADAWLATPTTVNLTMTASSQDTLAYSWQVTSSPAGAAAPQIENSEQQFTVVALQAAGTYTFQGTATDVVTGLSATSSATINVAQYETNNTVSPSSAEVDVGEDNNNFPKFTASAALDQFGALMQPQPNNFGWSVTDGSIGLVNGVVNGSYSKTGDFSVTDTNLGVTTVEGDYGTAPVFVYADTGTIHTIQNQPNDPPSTPQVSFSSPDGTVYGDPSDRYAYDFSSLNPSASSVELDMTFTNPTNNISFQYFGNNNAAPNPTTTIQVYTNGNSAGTVTLAPGQYRVDLSAYQDVTSIKIVTGPLDADDSIGPVGGIVYGLSFSPVPVGVAFGNGEPNQILQVSDDGTQNLLPLQIFLPPNLPSGTALTLSTSEPDDVDVWDTPNPSSGDAPLFGGGGADSISWTSGSGTIPTTLYVGAIQPSQAVGDLTFTLSALLPGAASATSQPTSTTSDASAAEVKIFGTFGSNNSVDITGNKQQSVIVGEGVQLVATVLPAGLNPSFNWTVPGNRVSGYNANNTTGAVVNTIQGDSQKQGLTFYWVDGSPTGADEDVKLTVTVAGQQMKVDTDFTVFKPSVQFVGTAVQQPTIVNNTITTSVRFDPNNFTVPQPFTGNLSYIQLITSDTEYQKSLVSGWQIKTTPAGSDRNYPYYVATAAQQWTSDSPFDSLDSTAQTDRESVNGFDMYLMFTPTFTNATLASIPVPLADSVWNMDIHAKWNGQNWSAAASAPTAPPKSQATTTFPQWMVNTYQALIAAPWQQDANHK